ncbi:BrxE family protein [Pseudomonas aeruginosa]|uniref:BrxE family protein n=1 Tax=Pseudomonas aeruginosa TaxID=287 RepID=UPI001297FD90|nr:BrxE family protein [Pseudomonas aeruginosa]
MKESYLSTLLQMRLIVGFLGERAQCAWWPTAFYEASSRLFLEPVFSKTSRLAQYHGVLEAARRLHDEHLSVGSYHLFRLPEEIEQDLHAMVQGGGGEELASQVAQSKEAAMDALKRLAATSGTPGVGRVSEILCNRLMSDTVAENWRHHEQDAPHHYRRTAGSASGQLSEA